MRKSFTRRRLCNSRCFIGGSARAGARKQAVHGQAGLEQGLTGDSEIRANVEAFVKAYNAGDAKAVANLFAPEAQTIDEDGETTQGRKAIEKRVAGTFAESPEGRIKLDVESIRFIGSAQPSRPVSPQ